MSMNILEEYRGYVGSYHFVPNGNPCYIGKVMGIVSTITFGGNTLDELCKDFKTQIDNYYQRCALFRQEPELCLFSKKYNSLKHPDCALRDEDAYCSVKKEPCNLIAPSICELINEAYERGKRKYN